MNHSFQVVNQSFLVESQHGLRVHPVMAKPVVVLSQTRTLVVFAVGVARVRLEAVPAKDGPG